MAAAAERKREERLARRHPDGSGRHPDGSGRHPDGSGRHPESGVDKRRIDKRSLDEKSTEKTKKPSGEGDRAAAAAPPAPPAATDSRRSTNGTHRRGTATETEAARLEELGQAFAALELRRPDFIGAERHVALTLLEHYRPDVIAAFWGDVEAEAYPDQTEKTDLFLKQNLSFKLQASGHMRNWVVWRQEAGEWDPAWERT
jgi:hypothetical protein